MDRPHLPWSCYGLCNEFVDNFFENIILKYLRKKTLQLSFSCDYCDIIFVIWPNRAMSISQDLRKINWPKFFVEMHDAEEHNRMP